MPIHKRSKPFQKQFQNLHPGIKKIAQEKFTKYKSDLFGNNSLKTRVIQKTRGENPCSYEITIVSDYKAVFQIIGGVYYWIWIGSHNDFDKQFS